MDAVNFILFPALLGGVGGAVDNVLQGEDWGPSAYRGLVTATVVAIVAYTIWKSAGIV